MLFLPTTTTLCYCTITQVQHIVFKSSVLICCLFFYHYREVFNKIASEEADLHSENSDSDFEIPAFGDSTSNYEEVKLV